ncbi:MAG: RDD family protein [Gammaproteobacteria bacterium]|nr:RDD family protein [Gammaproteobacteria bacterium]NNJ84372.1 RDD family protein [Gammaproteobacteria bacterium]
MQQNISPDPTTSRPAGLLRRFGAMFYDGLILFAIIICAHLPLQVFLGTAVILPGDTWHTAYQGYLLGVCFLYFGWCWTHGGQTLGMRTWRIYLRNKGNGDLSWGQSLIRFLCAILSWSVFGAGFLWALVDRERMTWHDRLSGTVLMFIPR